MQILVATTVPPVMFFILSVEATEFKKMLIAQDVPKSRNGERGMGNRERESGNEWSAVSY